MCATKVGAIDNGAPTNGRDRRAIAKAKPAVAWKLASAASESLFDGQFKFDASS